MSTNRTIVDLLAVQAIGGAEAIYLALHLALLLLQPRELGVARGKRAQGFRDQSTDRAATFRGADPRVAIDVVGD